MSKSAADLLRDVERFGTAAAETVNELAASGIMPAESCIAVLKAMTKLMEVLGSELEMCSHNSRKQLTARLIFASMVTRGGQDD